MADARPLPKITALLKLKYIEERDYGSVLHGVTGEGFAMTSSRIVKKYSLYETSSGNHFLVEEKGEW